LREELWKNGGVHIYKKGDKQKMENCRWIIQPNTCYKLYNKVSSERVKAQAEEFFFLNAKINSEKADLAVICCLVWNWS
jgi:hypothetical protein